MSKTLIAILLLLSVGCQSKEPDTKTVIKKAEVKQEVKNHPNENQIECDYLEDVENYLDEIITNPKKFVGGKDDNCVLSLIDTLSTLSVESADSRYLKAIGSICKISDGYVSEYLITIGMKQYYLNLNKLLNFIRSDACFREMVVMGLSMEVSVGGDREMKKLKAHSQSAELNEQEKKDVQMILSEVDPEIFD